MEEISRTLRVRFDVDNPDHMEEARRSACSCPTCGSRRRIGVPASELGQQYLSSDGRILAVPELAVVFTGSQKIVFRQETPSLFDAVQVELGPMLTGADGNA